MPTLEQIKFEFPGVRMCMVEEDHIYLSLINLVVEPDCRRQGVGARAVKEICAMARARKKRGVRVIAMPIGPIQERVDQLDLVRFYKHCGFALLADNETLIWRC